MTKETLILDTSAIVNQPNIFSLLDNTLFIIPIEVLEELDNLKTKNEQSGFNARKANRIIDEIRGSQNLANGVTFGNGNYIKVFMESNLGLVPSFYSQNIDSRIISVAMIYAKGSAGVKLVSSDISLRIKANSLGINSVSDDEVLFGKADIVYSGTKTINVDQNVISDFYNTGFVTHFRSDLFENQAVVLRSEESSGAIGVVKSNRIVKLREDKKGGIAIMGVSPRNKEQRFAFEYLLDQNIPLVSMIGQAGSGKTLCAAVAAMHMLDKGIYEKLVICRPAISASSGIGFLPGTLQEKMKPWVQPIFDNLKHAMKCTDTYLTLLMDKGKIEVESLSYIRGRTFPNTVIIIDEAQNATSSEMKAVITRMGENSKIIITGDLEQIDSPKLDIYSCGLSTVINSFKHSELTAHITMVKTERSEIAALAAKLL